MEKQKDHEVFAHLLRTSHRISIALRTFSGNLWVSNIRQRKTLMFVVSALWWVITIDTCCIVNLWAFSVVYGLWIFMFIIFWPLKSFEFVNFESCFEWAKIVFNYFEWNFCFRPGSVRIFALRATARVCSSDKFVFFLGYLGMKFSLYLGMQQRWREATH